MDYEFRDETYALRFKIHNCFDRTADRKGAQVPRKSPTTTKMTRRVSTPYKSIQKLRDLVEERDWPGHLLAELQLLNQIDRDTCALDIFDLDSMFSSDPEDFRSIMMNHNHLVIGCCGNGDFIAVDCVGRDGVVVYVSHEEFHYDPDPETEETIDDIRIVVAGSIRDFIDAIEAESLPMDYYEAERR